MKKILFTLCFCLLAFNANAQIRCHEDSLGYGIAVEQILTVNT